MNARAIITHSDRMPTNRDRLNAWSQGDYRQKRDAEMARELENKEKENVPARPE